MMEEQSKSSGYEPTVLDWVKSLIKLHPIPIPEPMEDQEQVEIDFVPVEIEAALVGLRPEPEPAIPIEARQISARHLRLPAALLLGFFAQYALESKIDHVAVAVAGYIFAGILIGWAAWAGDFRLPLPTSVEDVSVHKKADLRYLVAGIVLMFLTFFASRSNLFTFINLILWIACLSCFLVAFWEGDPPYQKAWSWAKAIWQKKSLDIHIHPWHVLVTACIIIIIFFRTTQIEQVPYEMWSDQAEKLWDVMDVLEGKYSIFFPRNTGREALQFYMAAAVVKLLNTGISFLTLKITSIFAGLLTLPYLYLFAKEFGGRYVGLAAVLLAGMGYWPNVISRLGLRFPLYPLFVAPALYYLLRGIRLRQRNDFLLCGFAAGIGLHGYSPARVIPFAVAVGVLIYALYEKSKAHRMKIFTWLGITGVIALAIFIPLLGAISDSGMMVLYLNRMVSRVSSIEQPLSDSPLKLLMENLWRGLRMFAWEDGEIWVVSIPYRPILDWITGAWFHLGAVIVFVRFLRTRRWQDLFLLMLIPILMLPSILSLAFPGENPAPNRASGAIIPAFTIAAIPLVLIPHWAKETFKSKIVQGIILSVALILLLKAALLNYDLVFHQFAYQHRQSTWNTNEIGKVIRGFAGTIGSYETSHVIAYPHWVDTRLTAVNAGDPGEDYGVWPENLDEIPPEPDRPQLFIFKPEDSDGLERLRELYPEGILKRQQSAVQGRDFMLYYVFPDESMDLDTVLP